MFKVVVDGKEIGRYAKVSFAKKQADLELELGGFSVRFTVVVRFTHTADTTQIGDSARSKQSSNAPAEPSAGWEGEKRQDGRKKKG